MAYPTPNFTKELKRTHKILISQHGGDASSLDTAARGRSVKTRATRPRSCATAGPQVAQHGLEYCAQRHLLPGAAGHRPVSSTPSTAARYRICSTRPCSSPRRAAAAAPPTISSLLRKALVKAGYGNVPGGVSLNFSGLEKDSGISADRAKLLRKVVVRRLLRRRADVPCATRCAPIRMSAGAAEADDRKVDRGQSSAGCPVGRQCRGATRRDMRRDFPGLSRPITPPCPCTRVPACQGRRCGRRFDAKYCSPWATMGWRRLAGIPGTARSICPA